MKRYLLVFFLFFSLPCAVISQSHNIDYPHIKWKLKTGAPIRGGIVADDQNIYFGNSDGGIFCVNKKTGKQVWQFTSGGAVTSTSALDDNILVVSARDNFVYGLYKTNGKLSWKFKMKPSSPHTWGWDYYDASPVIHAHTVYVGSGDHNLYALNTKKGDLQWKFETQDKIRASPQIVNEKIYVPSFDGYLYVINRKDGKFLEKFKTEGVDYYGKIFGWDRTSLTSKPATIDSLMVFGSRDGGLYCINTMTNKQKWRFSYGSSWVGSSPVIADSIVYVGWSDKLVFSAINLLTGREIWNYDCQAYVYSTPVYDKKNIYVGAFNGKVYSFNKASGKLIWEIQTGAPILSSPLLDKGHIYIGNDDGYLIAIESGKEVLKAVYLPDFNNNSELASDKKIGTYLEKNSFKKLDTITLTHFIKKRIADKQASVIVFAFQYLPKEITGQNARQSLLKKYMESGGRVVWLNYFPNFWTTDKALNITGYDPGYAAELLDIDFDVNMDFGTYFSKSTAKGLEWNLPASFNAPGNAISNKSKVVPLAFNEFGRITAFWKPFSSDDYAGFISFCSWSSMPIKQADLETIKAIAEYKLTGN